LKTQTGGRLKSVQDLLTDGTFFFTYGDGVADINITATLKAHKDAGRKATMSLAKPDGRFGAVTTNKHGQVTNFIEKPKGDGSYVNAGYFVLDHTVIDYITGPEISWEAEPLTYLTEAEELTAYKHNGFWKPMDTLRDKNQLEHLWNSRRAPWKVW
jgi:glucose-1-phosphate cytidylyltransferase